MIALAANCLLFRLANGESVPISSETISLDMMGDSARLFDAEFVQHAASAVFHYFKVELARQAVLAEEFKGALEKVLRGFSLNVPKHPATGCRSDVLDSDLLQLVADSGEGRELFFFPRLRDQFRKASQMPHTRTLRFRGLRGCVKRLAGARRWSVRCETLKEQILEYLRGCLQVETRNMNVALLVEC